MKRIIVAKTIIALILVSSLWLASPASTKTLLVEAGETALNSALAKAKNGDVIHLQKGVYQGPIIIDKSITLMGIEDGAEIHGNGKNSVITVSASNVTVRNLTVKRSGLLLETQDSGIFLNQQAEHAKILDNHIINNLIGVYIWGAKHSLVKGNVIVGRQDLRMNERGNGVQVWNAPGAKVKNNYIRFGRDGIFVTTSEDNIFSGNTFQNLRFGVHYMYTNQSYVHHNISRDNHLGYAIMYSKNIKIENNLSENDRNRGILFNYVNRITVKNNEIRSGPEKCVFIYNSNRNIFTGNTFSGCSIGIHFTGGSEHNEIYNNNLIDNRVQVKYVGTRWVEWSHNGRGNYWSDHDAFDLNADGLADRAYRPNDLTDQILWKYPNAKLLINSPAMQIIKWTQSSFPALYPGGVIDRYPLMSPYSTLEAS